MADSRRLPRESGEKFPRFVRSLSMPLVSVNFWETERGGLVESRSQPDLFMSSEQAKACSMQRSVPY